MTASSADSGSSVLLRGIGQLVSNDPVVGGLLGVLENAAVLISGGIIEWVGPGAEVPSADDRAEIDVEGRAVIPGFVDAHTHLVFAGDRADEFGRRLRGESYQEIMDAGGGIMSTVGATRAATAEDLYSATANRVERMVAAGTTTIEMKSGYGLDVATETLLLEVAARLDLDLPVDIVSTFLGAHSIPPEFVSDREGYLDLIENEMFPACAPLARFCDVFCEDGVFTLDETRRVLEAGKRYGLVPRLHADQLAASGGAGLAAELGAASADHLDHVTPEEIAAMATAGTAAVLLPGVSLSMRLPFPDPGPLLQAGLTVAIATDANPGTSYVLTMPFVVALACLEMGMSAEQAVWSATRGGALSLQLPDRGWIKAGAAADLVVLDADSYLHLPYRPDSDLVHRVVKSGRTVERSP